MQKLSKSDNALTNLLEAVRTRPERLPPVGTSCSDRHACSLIRTKSEQIQWNVDVKCPRCNMCSRREGEGEVCVYSRSEHTPPYYGLQERRRKFVHQSAVRIPPVIPVKCQTVELRCLVAGSTEGLKGQILDRQGKEHTCFTRCETIILILYFIINKIQHPILCKLAQSDWMERPSTDSPLAWGLDFDWTILRRERCVSIAANFSEEPGQFLQ